MMGYNHPGKQKTDKLKLMLMKKPPLFVAFSNQKGGVGKSAVTVLMASYYHYVKGMDVLVVDCDFPQHSINAMRERDKQTVMQHDYYKQLLLAQLERTGKKAWHIVTSKPGEARQAALHYLESSGEQVDLVLIDLLADEILTLLAL